MMFVPALTYPRLTSSPALATVPTTLSSIPKLVLLDRDGVINEDVGPPGVLTEDQFVLTPRAGVAIGNLKRSGCRVVVVTNQSCVGKGLMTPSGLDEIHCQMKALLIEQDKEATVDHIYACTSTKDMHDPRMKPGARMLLEAIEDANVSPQDCVLIGDTVSDLEAAASACISRRILVSTGYGHSIIGRPPRPPSAMDESDGVLCKLIENITAQHLDNIVSPQLQLAPTSIFPFDYALDLDKAVSYIVGGQK